MRTRAAVGFGLALLACAVALIMAELGEGHEALVGLSRKGVGSQARIGGAPNEGEGLAEGASSAPERARDEKDAKNFYDEPAEAF